MTSLDSVRPDWHFRERRVHAPPKRVFAAVREVTPGEKWAGDFATLDRPGYAKLAIDWRLEDGVLSTETRVVLTDEESRRAFRRYWLVIRPWSGLIRRVWLRAIARRAQRV